MAANSFGPQPRDLPPGIVSEDMCRQQGAGQPDPSMHQRDTGPGMHPVLAQTHLGGSEGRSHPHDLLIARHVDDYVKESYHLELQAALPQFTEERIERLMDEVLKRIEKDRGRYMNSGTVVGVYPGYAHENAKEGYDRTASPFAQPFIHKFLPCILGNDIAGSKTEAIIRSLIILPGDIKSLPQYSGLRALKQSGDPDLGAIFEILRAVAKRKATAITPAQFAVYAGAQLAESFNHVGRIGDLVKEDVTLAGTASRLVLDALQKTPRNQTGHRVLTALLKRIDAIAGAPSGRGNGRAPADNNARYQAG